MKLEVTEAQVSKYPNPIGFRTDDTVEVTERRDDEFPGWAWVRTADGNEGWAPEAYLNGCRASSDYTAKELNTTVGEILDGSTESNGWVWCRNARGDEGWVPVKTTKPI